MTTRTKPKRKGASRPQGPTLSEYAEKYILSRDLSRFYTLKIKHSAKKFSEFCGGAVCIADVDSDLMNRWIIAMQEARMNPRTVHNCRAQVLAVWRDAYEAGANDNPPLRVRRVKRPRLVIQCYTHAEINKLLKAAAELTTFFPNGVKSSEFWQAAINAGYSTGLRRADLLSVRRSQIREDGIATVVQHKTGYPTTVRFSDEAMRFIRLWKFNADTPALPWPYRPKQFSVGFVRLRKAAHVDRGTFKWLRRAAGSFADRERRGDGPRLLGHRCESMFRLHYEDPSVTQTVAVEPPKIEI